MEIMGKIGGDVFVKSAIKRIVISAEGVKYQVQFGSTIYDIDEADVLFPVEESQKVSNENDVIDVEATPVEEVPEEPVKEMPEAPVKRKPGRPKKTTVDDLMKKVKRDK